MTTFRIVLLPGMAADRSLFRQLKEHLGTVEVLEWVAPEKSESIQAYALRLSDRLKEIKEPLILGGVSFGGVVAQEMCAHLNPRALVLIGSLESIREVSWWLKPFVYGRGLVLMLPASWMQLGLRISRPVWSLCVGREMQMLGEQFVAADPVLVGWSLREMLRWKRHSQRNTSVFRIHGAKDRIVPISRVNFDVSVNSGGHVLTVTHPRHVADFLRDVQRKVSSPVAAY